MIVFLSRGHCQFIMTFNNEKKNSLKIWRSFCLNSFLLLMKKSMSLYLQWKKAAKIVMEIKWIRKTTLSFSSHRVTIIINLYFYTFYSGAALFLTTATKFPKNHRQTAVLRNVFGRIFVFLLGFWKYTSISMKQQYFYNFYFTVDRTKTVIIWLTKQIETPSSAVV